MDIANTLTGGLVGQIKVLLILLDFLVLLKMLLQQQQVLVLLQ
jgi:hypothetical protein